MSEKENKALKLMLVRGEVVIDFIADQSTLDLNQLRWCYSHFCE